MCFYCTTTCARDSDTSLVYLRGYMASFGGHNGGSLKVKHPYSMRLSASKCLDCSDLKHRLRSRVR
jgi:hypothetical protein